MGCRSASRLDVRYDISDRLRQRGHLYSDGVVSVRLFNASFHFYVPLFKESLVLGHFDLRRSSFCCTCYLANVYGLVFKTTYLWTYYLANVYGLVFAVLITLYLAGLFTWKTTTIFGVLLTIMDIILVFVTRTMVEAAKAAVSLKLPVMVLLPFVPPAPELGFGASLGLGDFFFAGLLSIQTFKKYGKQFAILSATAMAISFFIFDIFWMNYWRIPFAGTLIIICGWAPLVIWKQLTRKSRVTEPEAPAVEEEPNV